MAEKTKTVGEVKLTNVRLSFAQLFEAKKFGSGEGEDKPTFQASFLFPKGTAEGKAMYDLCKQAIRAAAAEKWGDNTPKLKPDKFALRDGNAEDYDGYEDQWYVAARSPANRPPVVVDRNRKPITSDNGRIYSGCYVNAIVRFWAQDNTFGKRINASLEAVQFVRDGDAFGAPPVDPNEAFDDVEDGDDSPRQSGGDEDNDLL